MVERPSTRLNPESGIKAGVWEHRSGGRYLVLGIGRFDEDNDLVVIYVRLYARDDGGPPITVRRAEQFLKGVPWPDGQIRPRFRFLGAVEPS